MKYKEENVEKGLKLLKVYALAIRCYWGEIDGRTVRSDIGYICDSIENGFSRELSEEISRLGICEPCGVWQHMCWEPDKHTKLWDC